MFRLILLFCSIFLSSCKLTSTGGYLHGTSTNEAFSGLHAATAEVLVPTLNGNNCILLTPEQIRQYKIEGKITETNDQGEEVKINQEYMIANSCHY